MDGLQPALRTDNSERAKLGSTWFHHTALGLTSTTTNDVDTGFIHEPAGTLNSITGKLGRRQHRLALPWLLTAGLRPGAPLCGSSHSLDTPDPDYEYSLSFP
ncbi:hypothetical protein [Streptomyces koelreuteriae]|uniref:hypothetical protein n=1 Tax=Streptomyces koelreuteriae TaxID=2838015 RepID=UPI003EB92E50